MEPTLDGTNCVLLLLSRARRGHGLTFSLPLFLETNRNSRVAMSCEANKVRRRRRLSNSGSVYTKEPEHPMGYDTPFLPGLRAISNGMNPRGRPHRVRIDVVKGGAG